MLLSIDCGIKNLAMCLLDPASKKIRQWDVSGVPPQHSAGLFPCMVKHLDSKPWTLEATTVVIEKQPDRNRSMKSIENLLHTYFLIKGKEVVIWDARFKVPDCAGTGKAMYDKRKKTSVKRAREFIEGTEWVSFFDAHKKKDDLADTVMLCRTLTGKWSRHPRRRKRWSHGNLPRIRYVQSTRRRISLGW
jgi:Poxvirus A22 protein